MRKIYVSLLTFAVFFMTWANTPAIPLSVKQVSSKSGAKFCSSCHQQQYKAWQTSHHFHAMAVASPQSVLGNFNQQQFTHFGVTSRFYKKDGKYFVNTEGADGKLHDFEVKYTFGYFPLQQYLVELPKGHLQALLLAWDVKEKKWFHLYPHEKIDYTDPLHWTKLFYNWNSNCAECHSTHLQKNYDVKTNTFVTTWDEINVSCQSCHGSLIKHLNGAHGLTGITPTSTAEEQMTRCAPCHARRAAISAEYSQAKSFLDNYIPALLRQTIYYPDGQILAEDYEYGSFLQSKMYQRGVRCSDCHNPHTLKLKAPDNAVCLQCHNPKGNPRFPSLPLKDFNSPTHHFHLPGSSGSKCINCHMPAKTYMVNDKRYDHSFRIPRPDLTIKIGTPNTCNACHTDKSPQWAMNAINKWYGKKNYPLHYGEIFAAAEQHKPSAMLPLQQLILDATKPAIVRATAIELLAGYGMAGFTQIAQQLNAADPLLRYTAVKNLEWLDNNKKVSLLSSLLNDPVRAVRTEAARILAGIPAELFTQQQMQILQQDLQEYTATQAANLDLPASHLNLGVLNTKLGDASLAVLHYQHAIALDASFLPAYFNLANLYNALGKNNEAEKTLRSAIRNNQNQGQLYYSLGLLLAEEKEYPEAVAALNKATQLLPDNARVFYNYGLVLQIMKDNERAEKALLKAYELDPQNPDIKSLFETIKLNKESGSK